VACKKVITLCNGDETCAECVAVLEATACEPGQEVTAAACEPFDLQFCLSDDCVAAADAVDLTLYPVNKKSDGALYTQSIPPVSLLVYTIPADTLTPGWYLANLTVLNAGVVVREIRFFQYIRINECPTPPAELTCLAGNEPETVDPDDTSFSCCQ